VALAGGVIERTAASHRFRHSLVRDALLDGLQAHRLLALHRRAAEAQRDGAVRLRRESVTNYCRLAMSAPLHRSCYRPPEPRRPLARTRTHRRSTLSARPSGTQPDRTG
jgi:hypothetical protein